MIRLGQCFFWWPAQFSDALRYVPVILSKAFAKLTQATRNSLHSKHCVVPFVSCLLNHRGPANVGHFIIPVNVHSFNRPSFFPMANIFKKVLERLPSFADRYSSAAIVFEVRVLWSIASRLHLNPNIVNARLGHSVSRIESCGGFSNQATTGFCSSFQRAIANSFGNSTFAKTQTHSVCSTFVNIIRRFCDDFELSECSSDERFSGRHNVHSISDVVFSSGRPATTGAHCDYGTT